MTDAADRRSFELEIPGSRIVTGDSATMTDADWAAKAQIEVLLHTIQWAFSEASIACLLFAGAGIVADLLAEKKRADKSFEKMEARVREKYGAEAALGNVWYLAHQLDVRESLERGELPERYVDKMPFFYAKAFVYAADSIGMMLLRLGECADVPDLVKQSSSHLYDALPTLKGIRDTLQHMEDRARRRGRGQGKLKLKPIDQPGLKAPHGTLALGQLSGDLYGTIMSDGHFGQIAINEASLKILRDVIQSVLDAFTWKGPPEYYV